MDGWMSGVIDLFHFDLMAASKNLALENVLRLITGNFASHLFLDQLI